MAHWSLFFNTIGVTDELDTMVRQNLTAPVAGKGACWTQIALEQKLMLRSDVACQLTYDDYEKDAIGLGAIGMEVDGTCEFSGKFREAVKSCR